MPMPMYTFTQPPFEAARCDANDVTALIALGCTVYNGPDDVLVIQVGETQIPIPDGSWAVKSNDPNDTWTYRVYSDAEFRQRFTAMSDPTP